jgi:hypothetical protein
MTVQCRALIHDTNTVAHHQQPPTYMYLAERWYCVEYMDWVCPGGSQDVPGQIKRLISKYLFFLHNTQETHIDKAA